MWNKLQNQNIEIISLDHEKYKPQIQEQKSLETFSNLASLLQSFEIGKNEGDDLVFFIEVNHGFFPTVYISLGPKWCIIMSVFSMDTLIHGIFAWLSPIVCILSDLLKILR